MTATGIDPRSPRFGAGITAVLLLVVIALALATPLGSTIGARLVEPAFIVFAVISALFAWGAFAGIRRHPYGVLFRRLIRPRLAPPTELEDPTPPTFAQGVGFIITFVGLALHLAGVPFAIVVAASAAFVAAFLNSVFGYCLGCQIYLALARTGIIGKRGASEASSA
ncbi:membrane protein implicated in regulation of membrane protease activity [Microbacteriaceae bacterium SG_E_30_P1]|uniref:Membrane protein implicated in regulation of membrane protease activity n=1 Tax=Antiquaquibacter oligotrophicus TaxID=2880260 RepID=A0ABT6KLE7_9MICO|nr:DUF4395 domain-containing protein [Antiquaquibacter oligotrophicus]MDH6180679.1 membrane protein implicated in regulation of membrane protease activity [Antiquaquibacter oligotrophicus]UDF13594.1 DUF4395 domain-containing protein [Antiquaquibacter oligotrophicus]